MKSENARVGYFGLVLFVIDFCVLRAGYILGMNHDPIYLWLADYWVGNLILFLGFPMGLVLIFWIARMSRKHEGPKGENMYWFIMLAVSIPWVMLAANTWIR